MISLEAAEAWDAAERARAEGEDEARWMRAARSRRGSPGSRAACAEDVDPVCGVACGGPGRPALTGGRSDDPVR